MKKIMVIAIAGLFAMGCNTNTTSTENKATTTEPAEKIDYAYVPANHQPDNWDRGDQKNVALVLKSLKAYENKDVEGALSVFADSVRWSADNFDAKLSKDSLRSMFTSSWKGMTAFKVVMDDYEAVISKDKKVEYVTLWYKQIMTDTKGMTDSMAIVDDAKIENGKITELDEKMRRYPKMAMMKK